MTDWTLVGSVEDLPPDSKTVVDVDGAMVAVVNVEDEYHAIEDICTHDGGELASGELDGCELICPRHGARFCLKTGEALSAPAYEDVYVFPTKVEDSSLFVRDDRWD